MSWPFLPLDSEGYLVNDCPPEVGSPWEEAIQEIAARYREHFQERLHSAYVRGSVARGTAISHISDIDTLAVIWGVTHRGDFEWLGASAADLGARHPYAQKVELAITAMDHLEANDRMRAEWFFILKTQSRCLAGTDLAPGIPRMRPAPGIAMELPRIQTQLGRALRQLDSTDDAARIQRICHTIMKRIVRSGFELVIERVNSYTRDLSSCLDSFSRFYPQKRRAMREAFDLAISPSTSRDEVLAVLSDLGAWLVEEREEVMRQVKSMEVISLRRVLVESNLERMLRECG